MKHQIFITESYQKQLNKIKDFILKQSDNLSAVDGFVTEHDAILEFILTNPKTPAQHPATGDQSWPFSNGRYRLFFRIKISKDNLKLYLLDLIDNRQANLKVYPNNSLPTFFEEED